jgi:hypothetical protein
MRLAPKAPTTPALRSYNVNIVRQVKKESPALCVRA